jgi:FkbM family methyltransferase
LAEQRSSRAEIARLYDQLFLNNPVLLLQSVKINLPLFYVDHIQKIIYETRNFYEIDTLEFLRLHYRQFDFIVEVGANIGNHVLYYCSHLQPKKVYCFEPGQFSLTVLKKNIELNYLEDKVIVYPFAAGAKSGQGHQEDFSLANTGMNRVVVADGGNGESVVEIRSLDSLSFARVDFIKIDVEGGELSVLEGAKETIHRCRPVLLVEVFEERCQDIDNWMENIGYSRLIRLGLHNNLYVPH